MNAVCQALLLHYAYRSIPAVQLAVAQMPCCCIAADANISMQ
jgi:hypothetical protein